MAIQAKQGHIQEIRENIDHAMHDLIKLKKEIILLGIPKKEKSERAWNKLMVLSEKVTKLWKGPGAVEEIRLQREKRW